MRTYYKNPERPRFFSVEKITRLVEDGDYSITEYDYMMVDTEYSDIETGVNSFIDISKLEPITKEEFVSAYSEVKKVHKKKI